MYIIIDTCALYGDQKLIGSKIRALCEIAKISGDFVFLPEIVIEEINNIYHDNLTTALSSIDKELSDIKRLTGVTHTSTYNNDYLNKEFKEYLSTFSTQIRKLRIKRIPYPKTPHSVLAKKAVLKKKPFSESGKGYRDALIWENIKDIYSKIKNTDNSPLILITNNTKDFCEKGDLHPLLIAELADYDKKKKDIFIETEISSFITNYYNDKLEFVDFKTKFEDNDTELEDLKLNIEKQIFKFLEYRSFDFDESPFSSEYESPTVTDIHEDYAYYFQEFKLLSDKEILISLKVKVICTFDVFIFKSNYLVMDEDSAPKIWDNDWNEHYFACSEDNIVSLNILLIIERTTNELISIDIDLT